MNCVYWLKNRLVNVTISYFLFLLVISSFTTHNRIIPTICMAEGRAISKLIEAAQESSGGMEEESKVVRVVVGNMRSRQIGSRPPRCERRCSGCGHCEAVQVPVVPQVLLHQNDDIRSRTRQYQNDNNTSRRRSHSSRFSFKNKNNVAYSRGDDVSNYKPMSWKCKCGDFLFNP